TEVRWTFERQTESSDLYLDFWINGSSVPGRPLASAGQCIGSFAEPHQRSHSIRANEGDAGHGISTGGDVAGPGRAIGIDANRKYVAGVCALSNPAGGPEESAAATANARFRAVSPMAEAGAICGALWGQPAGPGEGGGMAALAGLYGDRSSAQQ